MLCRAVSYKFNDVSEDSGLHTRRRGNLNTHMAHLQFKKYKQTQNKDYFHRT
jgi:hypothetical protein